MEKVITILDWWDAPLCELLLLKDWNIWCKKSNLEIVLMIILQIVRAFQRKMDLEITIL
jgi:hypothetical protein